MSSVPKTAAGCEPPERPRAPAQARLEGPSGIAWSAQRGRVRRPVATILALPAFTGWLGYLSTGGDPVRALAIPSGVILISAAVGIANGLSSGLETRIHEWIAGRVVAQRETFEDVARLSPPE
jgi:hypothetical protein